MAASSHEKFNWKAEEFFIDPKVVALCKAIEADDVAEIGRLAAAGADVNARGQGNMTPLLWAFPDNKPDRLKKLLELGADPNVIVESDFNTRGLGILPGDSVTHLACKTEFPHYFDYVFDHGGDPNLYNRRQHGYPLHLVLRGLASDKSEKIKRLLGLGADVNAKINDSASNGDTPVKTAASYFAQYDLALQLLEAGAEYRTYFPNTNMKLIHIVAQDERLLSHMDETKTLQYKKLVAWLESHGESYAAAKADLDRWNSWCCTPADIKRLRMKETGEREAREARGTVEDLAPDLAAPVPDGETGP